MFNAWSLPLRHLEPRRDDKTHSPIHAPGGAVLRTHKVGVPSASIPYCHFCAQANMKQWHLQISAYWRIFFFASERQSL